MTNLLTATIMIVFAGGPHTPERTALACEILTNQPPPSIIYLTGVEFCDEYSHLTAQVRSIAATLPTHPEVLTDHCHTTWESCRHLASEMQTRDHRLQTTDLSKALCSSRSVSGTAEHSSAATQKEEDAADTAATTEEPKAPLTSHVLHLTLTVITSNYHAPRVRWLLAGVLPAFYQTEKEKSIEQKPAKATKGRDLVSAGGGGKTSSLCALCPSVQDPDPARLTSHASRFTIFTSPDIPWRQSLATSRNRQLIFGECISWLYCFPLGLIYRPWWLAGTGLLLIGITLITRPTATSA